MRSIKELVQQEGLGDSPVSLKAIVQQHGVNSLKALVASHDIRDFHRQTNGEWGPLGATLGTLHHQPNGTYIQNFQLGYITKQDNSTPQAVNLYSAEVSVAAVKCFGTEDPGGTDELYAVITLISINPSGNGDQVVKSVVLGSVDVDAGGIVFVGESLGTIPTTGSGIRINVALFDREYGDPETVKQRIQGYFLEGAKTVATAIYGAVGWAFVEGILDSKIGRGIIDGLLGWIGELFEDDPIGARSYNVTLGDLVHLTRRDEQGGFPNYLASRMTTPGLPSHVRFNFPKDHGDEYWLISGGGGSYKVFFDVKAIEIPIAITPPS